MKSLESDISDLGLAQKQNLHQGKKNTRGRSIDEMAIILFERLVSRVAKVGNGEIAAVVRMGGWMDGWIDESRMRP